MKIPEYGVCYLGTLMLVCLNGLFHYSVKGAIKEAERKNAMAEQMRKMDLDLDAHWDRRSV